MGWTEKRIYNSLLAFTNFHKSSLLVHPCTFQLLHLFIIIQFEKIAWLSANSKSHFRPNEASSSFGPSEFVLVSASRNFSTCFFIVFPITTRILLDFLSTSNQFFEHEILSYLNYSPILIAIPQWTLDGTFSLCSAFSDRKMLSTRCYKQIIPIHKS